VLRAGLYNDITRYLKPRRARIIVDAG